VHEKLVVLTGAGISAESGVPTFRGTGGIWKEHRAQDLATQRAFTANPELVWDFYAWRRDLIAKCLPNPAHKALYELGKRTDLILITQNVDGLHRQAGSKDVLELHGNIWRMRCTACELHWEDRHVPLVVMPPRCEACGALARPDVVWFGEHLPGNLQQDATRGALSAKTFVLIGTSGQVYPVAGFAQIAKNAGARVVEINPERTPRSDLADEVYRGDAAEMVARWLDRGLTID